MKKQIEIARIKQSPEEPFCGAITYKIITKDKRKIKNIHEKARIKPSFGFFYTSFLKLNPNLHAYIENKNNLLNTKDTKMFDSMWTFESKLQKISKEEFIKQTILNNQKIYEKNKKYIHIYQKIPYTQIINNSLMNDSSLAVLVMENLNKHLKKKREFFIPHWITIHGMNKKNYLIFNSYKTKSETIEKQKLIEKIDNVKNYGFSPQIITLHKLD